MLMTRILDRTDLRADYMRQRLKLGLAALRRLSLAGCLPKGYKAMWPDTGFERYLDQPAERTEVRLQASQEELRALSEVEVWLYAIPVELRLAVFLRAYHPNAGWRRIGWFLSCSYETARQREAEGIEELCRLFPGEDYAWGE